MKLRVVLDTNVLVSHFVLPDQNPTKVLRLAHARAYVLVLSDVLLEEFRGVMRDKLEYSPAEAALAEDSIREIAEVVAPVHAVDAIAADEADNRVLECALSGGAQIIVSGDRRHLLPLKSYRGIRILSPREFLKELVG